MAERNHVFIIESKLPTTSWYPLGHTAVLFKSQARTWLKDYRRENPYQKFRIQKYVSEE